jgi:hypothetical protein
VARYWLCPAWQSEIDTLRDRAEIQFHVGEISIESALKGTPAFYLKIDVANETMLHREAETGENGGAGSPSILSSSSHVLAPNPYYDRRQNRDNRAESVIDDGF